jgi:hypothetical protein
MRCGYNLQDKIKKMTHLNMGRQTSNLITIKKGAQNNASPSYKNKA